MRVLASLVALAALATAACASEEPVLLSSGFTTYGKVQWAFTPKGKAPATCRVSIGEVVDARSDTQSMGRFGGRYVRRDDTVGWVRSGLETLARDKRFEFVSAAEAGDGVVIHATLAKAYMEGLATSKNATVVLRVRYERTGETIGENTFRGDYTDVNWGSGDGEARDSLNIALQEALAAIDADLFARCSKPPEPKPAPASDAVAN